MLNQLAKQTSGPLTSLRHIDVRIRPIAHQAIAEFDHCLGHIRVPVDTGNDWDLWPDDRSDPAQQFTLTVVIGFGHHRSVEVKVNPREWSVRCLKTWIDGCF